jgi:exosortase
MTSITQSSTRAPVSAAGRAASPAIDWRKVAFQAAVVGALLMALYWHVLYVLVYKWANSGDWSHGFLIPVFSVYYLYVQRHRFPHGMYRTGYLGLLILVVSFGLYVDTTVWHQFTYLKMISLVFAIFGAVYLLCGWPIARWAWFAVAFLFFSLPIPGRYYTQLTMPLQITASTVSATVLNAIPEMEADAENVVISYMYKGEEGELNVEQACSGIRLMMAFVALGVAMAFASERPLWHRMIMILSCIPIAIFCNVIRVTTTGFFVVFGRPELARGFYHTMLGLSMLLIAFGLFGLISHVLNHLFVDAPEEDGEAPARPRAAGV